jgi:hypothetical protein
MLIHRKILDTILGYILMKVMLCHIDVPPTWEKEGTTMAHRVA